MSSHRRARYVVAALTCLLLCGGCAALIGLEQPSGAGDGGAGGGGGTLDGEIGSNDGSPTDAASFDASVAFSSLFDPAWNGGNALTITDTNVGMATLPLGVVVYFAPAAQTGPLAFVGLLSDEGSDGGFFTLALADPGGLTYLPRVITNLYANRIGLAGVNATSDPAAERWAAYVDFDNNGAPQFDHMNAIAVPMSNGPGPRGLAENEGGPPLMISSLGDTTYAVDSADAAQTVPGNGDVIAVAALPYASPQDFVVLDRSANGALDLARYEVSTSNSISAFAVDASTGVTTLMTATLASGGPNPLLLGVTPGGMLASAELVTLTEDVTTIAPLPATASVAAASTNGTITVVGGCIGSASQRQPWVARLNGNSLDSQFRGGLIIAIDYAGYCINSIQLDAQNRVVALLARFDATGQTPRDFYIVRFRATIP